MEGGNGEKLHLWLSNPEAIPRRKRERGSAVYGWGEGGRRKRACTLWLSKARQLGGDEADCACEIVVGAQFMSSCVQGGQ